MVTKYTSNYLFGKFTDIFAPLQTNSEIAKRMEIIKTKVVSGSPVFMLGYGASGAGKTSSLVYFNKVKHNLIGMVFLFIYAINYLTTIKTWKCQL